jgi:DNA-binding transcriptional regulator YbjK
MPATQKRHRASAQRRRDSLLTAAAELSAEVGAGAVTHRAVAARAGVPLSTTSYFFGSIDELVTEALRVGSTGRFDRLRATEQAAVEQLQVSACEAIRTAVDGAMANPKAAEGDQIEFFLAAGRQEALRDEAAAMVDTFVDLVQDQLEEVDAPQAASAAWAIAALGDGAMLHRFADLHDDHPDRLGGALRLLIAAAMLTDDEVAGALARYGGSEQSTCR